MKNVFEYINYRDFLKDKFADLKGKCPFFSHRYLAGKLGLSTPNFILLVMQGKRNLNPSLANRLATVLKLDAREVEYFETMVNFLQSKSTEDKDRYFARMLDMRRHAPIEHLTEQQYEYYANWYNLVIRELVAKPGFDGDFERLARRVRPAITASQAKKAVDLLLSLGLLKEEKGRYIQSAALITADPDLASVAIPAYHRTMAQIAAQAVDSFHKTERDMSSCTVALDDVAMKKVREEVAASRRRIMELAGEVAAPNRIYQANFQVFPVSSKDF